MKIKLIISLICFYSFIYSMDDATQPTINSNKALITSNPADVIIPISSEQPKRKMKKRVLSEPINSGEIRIPITSEDRTQKRKSIVPPLDLNATHNPASNGSESSSKKTVRDFDELKNAASKKKITGRGKNAGSGDMTTMRGHITRSRPEYETAAAEGDDMPLHKNPSFVPTAIAMHNPLASNEKVYTEDEVWEMLQKSNPQLIKFANEHRMDLEEVMDFADLLEELDIDPCVIIKYAQQNISGKQMNWLDSGLAYLFGESKEKSYERLIKDLIQIKGTDPDNYKAMVLEVMRAAYQEANGIERRSIIADTHTKLQNDQIDEQASDLRKQMFGNVVQFLLTIGTTVWAVYGQVNGGACSGNSTMH